MRKLKLYLDTSIINYLFADDAPKEKEITHRLFNSLNSGEYEVYISDVVIKEIEKTPNLEHRQRLLDQTKQNNLISLESSEEIEQMAKNYISENIIPEHKLEDALHIAFATVHELDILVSWNYEHLANIKKEEKINSINIKSGYTKLLRMITPLEVIGDET